MSLTKPHKRILMAAIGLFSLSELFPHWQYEYLGYNGKFTSQCPGGYRPIFSPPSIFSYDEMLRRCGVSDLNYESLKVQQDLFRLKDQRVILVLMTIGGWLIFATQKTMLKTIAGWLLFIVGIGFSVIHFFAVLIDLDYM